MEKKAHVYRSLSNILKFSSILIVTSMSFELDAQVAAYPYTETFDAAAATTTNTPNGAGLTVNLAKTTGVTGNCAGIDFQNSAANDSWFWIYFTAGAAKAYTISFSEKRCTKIDIYIGSTKTVAAMTATTAIYSQNTYASAFTARTASHWSAPSAGNYYIGFRVTNGTVYTSRIDDITITEASALPITLVSFNAMPQKNSVELKWVTASEKNTSFFEIEKSIDGELFEVIDKVDAAGTSIEMLTYSELDRNPTQGISYYRLKQFDLDGSFKTSEIRSVVYGSKSSNKLIPNPSNGMFVTLILKGTNYQKSEAGTISIINELGQVVHKEAVQMNSISFTMTPSSRLSPGYYSVVVMQGDKRIASEKMVVNW